MSNPLQGWKIISRGTLNEMVRDSYRRERELNQRIADAVDEFRNQSKGIKRINDRVILANKIAAKYELRNEFFINKLGWLLNP